MGCDFVEKATDTLKKSWDKEKVALGTADLFTLVPECAPRTVAADITEDAHLSVGDCIMVETVDGALVARQGNTEVARATDPPRGIRQAVVDSCGISKGTVETVYHISGVVEISLC